MVHPTEDTAPDSTAGDRLIYRRRHRLSGLRAYADVHRAGVRKPRGPLIVIGRPNGTPESRLGLSVSRRVGGAVTRTVIKRRLREAFRLSRPAMPPGYDLVVIVRPHEPAPLEQYRRWLTSAWVAVDRASARRPGPGAPAS